MHPVPTREELLAKAFAAIPSKIGERQLRPLAAGSFALLTRLKNPLLVGFGEMDDSDRQAATFSAVMEYVWIHSAPIDEVAAVGGLSDVPVAAIRKLGLELSLPEVVEFLTGYQDVAARMNASLAEPEEAAQAGQPGKPPASTLVGSPPSVSPSGPPVIPSGSATSSGSCPSSAPSVISTPQTSPTEPPADGLVRLPDLTSSIPPNPSISPSDPVGPVWD
jgi:hypothetical protein